MVAATPPSAAGSDALPHRAVGTERRWRAAALLLLAVLTGVMLATVGDYGMTGDEGVQHRYARRVLRWYATLGADRSAVADEDISMYGGLFEAVAEGAALALPFDPYRTRHVVNVVFALAAVAAVVAMGRCLGGWRAGTLSAAFLALTPAFYGHAFNNPKDIPFAGTFAVAVWAILAASDRSPRLRRRDVILTGLAIGLAAGVRVAGIALFGFALVLWMGVSWVDRRQGVQRLGGAWLAVVAIGWVVMLAGWPWAQVAPLSHPLRALGAFSRFWETMVVFYDGQYVTNGQVSRWYLPRWLALTLPETYFVAALMAVLRLAACLRARPWTPGDRVRLVQAAWIAGVAAVPVGWIVLRHTPLYDGMRQALFVVPLLAVLAGTAAAAAWSRKRSRVDVVLTVVLGAAACLTLADMIALHPYEALYFNRLVAGGLGRAVERYDTDYWCLTYKEGAEWLLARYAGADCAEKIRVGGHSILLQTAYYLKATDEGRRLFSPVTLDDDPNYALATTRFGDHQRTPGRLVHTVDRQGARLLYVFEVKPPACTR
jgi:hypothetical protein